jgi:fructose-1,6-bisphosphatase/inositol monophosphatase family enzyme
LTLPRPAATLPDGPENEVIPVGAEHLWIVDPVCGSVTLAQSILHLAISIALGSAGPFRVGVVHAPCRDELFQATFDGPAMLNGGYIASTGVLMQPKPPAPRDHDRGAHPML